MTAYKILLVDDDPLILKALGTELEGNGYEVETAEDGETSFRLLGKKTFDLVITDLVMNEVDGIGVLARAKTLGPETMVIILTGHGDMASAVDALRLDADDYLIKPCEPEEIHFRVKRCFERMELSKKLRFYENLLPVCCVCKRIRDDEGKEPGSGRWINMEDYIVEKSNVDVTSSYCPECAEKLTEGIEDP
jgi:DNA-binding response OmpR family regulator